MISCHEIIMLVTTGSNDFDNIDSSPSKNKNSSALRVTEAFASRSGESMGDIRGAENRTNIPLLYRYSFLAMRDMMASLR